MTESLGSTDGESLDDLSMQPTNPSEFRMITFLAVQRFQQMLSGKPGFAVEMLDTVAYALRTEEFLFDPTD